MAKYASVLRPVSIGTYPKPEGNKVVEIQNFDERKNVYGFDDKRGQFYVSAWGTIKYKYPLTKKDATNYDLIQLD